MYSRGKTFGEEWDVRWGGAVGDGICVYTVFVGVSVGSAFWFYWFYDRLAVEWMRVLGG